MVENSHGLRLIVFEYRSRTAHIRTHLANFLIKIKQLTFKSVRSIIVLNQSDSDRSRDRLTTKFSKDHSFPSSQYVAVVSLQEGVIEKLRFWFGLKLRKLPFGKDPEQTSEKCVLFFFHVFYDYRSFGLELSS